MAALPITFFVGAIVRVTRGLPTATSSGRAVEVDGDARNTPGTLRSNIMASCGLLRTSFGILLPFV